MRHIISKKDCLVRGFPGTAVWCTCGWRDEWAVQDGSAEACAHDHVMNNDPVARAEHEEYMKEWQERNTATTVKITPAASPSKSHEHNCSCHINPPCSNCENCKHWDEPDCDNDCQDCDINHEEE